MAEPAERRAVAAEHNVSRETSRKLDILVDELGRWQTIKNLVGPGTLAEVWTRHIADSLQLLAIEPQALRWADLGSGAGFPGLVLAIALAERAGAHVHLVESNSRKCAFLRHVARLAGAPATIHEARIEAVVSGLAGAVEIVTARALAPLARTRRLVRTAVENRHGRAVSERPRGAVRIDRGRQILETSTPS